jgi:hypothetical protein
MTSDPYRFGAITRDALTRKPLIFTFMATPWLF